MSLTVADQCICKTSKRQRNANSHENTSMLLSASHASHFLQHYIDCTACNGRTIWECTWNI